MDALKRVQPGADLVITASTWNRFIDTAQRSAAEPRPSAGGRPLEGSAWRPAVTVLVNNTGGTAIAPRAVLTPTGAVLDPATDPLGARRTPVVTGAAPASATDPVVIVLDGIAPGAVGRAVVAGVTVAQVSVTSTSHRFARPVVGDSSQLISAAAGPVRLFVPPVATGTQTVYVVLGSAGTGTSDGGGGGTDGNCFGDGWRIGLTAEDEWALRVLADGESIYVEDGATVEINGVEYEIDFNYATPSLSLISPVGSAPPIVGTLDCTACPCFKFAFKRAAFGLDATVPHGFCARILYVTVCQYCPAGWYCARDAGTDDPFEPVELPAGAACSGALEIFGGPYVNEVAANAACGPITNRCCGDLVLPRTVQATISNCGAVPDGTTVTLTYGAEPEIWPTDEGYGAWTYRTSGSWEEGGAFFYLACGQYDGWWIFGHGYVGPFGAGSATGCLASSPSEGDMDCETFTGEFHGFGGAGVHVILTQ